MKRYLATGRFWVTLLILLSACVPVGGPQAPQPGEAEPIKIGVIEPLSGPAADAGSYVVNGARIAVDRINGRGGVLGRKLTLVIEDNKSDPAETVSATEKLITRDRVPVIMGAWGSSMTLAAIPVVQRYGIPLLVETSSSVKITTPENTWVFRISPTSPMEADATRDLLPSLGLNACDFLSVNTDWGRGAEEAFRAALQQVGGKAGQALFFDQAATDFSPQITRLRDSELPCVIITTNAPQIAQILRQMQELGVRKRVLTTGGSNFPDAIVEQAGREAAEGSYHIVFFTPWYPNESAVPDEAEAFVRDYQQRYPWRGVGEAYRGYDGIKVIAAAIERAQVPEPARIRDALKDTRICGLSGCFVFNEIRQARPDIFVVQVRDGKAVIVARSLSPRFR